jgi:4-amino-4-deoxy-L-arabinose transferase-like glycosyltransferase
VRSVVVACFVLAFGLLFAWNCWRRDFWNTDEPLFAEVARTMERTGDWIVPKCNVPFLDLPPLTYWLSAAVHSITGLDPRAAYRLPVSAAAVLGLWLTFVAGKQFFSPSVGFLAVIIQASTGLYFWRAAWLDDDLIFAVCCQLAITCFALASRSTGRPALHRARLGRPRALRPDEKRSPRRPPRWWPAARLPAPRGRLAGARAGLGRVLRLPGFILALAIALPWFGAVAAREGKLLFEQHFLGAHFERIWSSPVHAEPPYFYLGTLLVGFLPWSLFLPLGILHGKDRCSETASGSALVGRSSLSWRSPSSPRKCTATSSWRGPRSPSSWPPHFSSGGNGFRSGKISCARASSRSYRS